ncbi:MAG: hypothetical protein EON98_01545 [Chitinophagaceae bacterium]|nr:MAG: hypothetical protein EON98_01545 [Chitinophagaceae bacterium]
MKKPATYKYIPIASASMENKLLLKDLFSFQQFLEATATKIVFVKKNEEGGVTHFCAAYQGLWVEQLSEGFASLEDFLQSQGFPGAASFYDAQSMGCNSFYDYCLLKETGITNISEVERLKEAGFVEGYEEWKSKKDWQALLPATVVINHAYDLYRLAMSNGFSLFSHFREAVQKGFLQSGLYEAAKTRGYENAVDFLQGQKAGFADAAEWKYATGLGIETKEELQLYQELELVGTPQLKHDERLLLVLLSKLPEKKKVSRNKLLELYSSERNKYMVAETENLHGWFSTAFTDSEIITNFLLKNEAVKPYGHYDADGEYFETNFLQNRHVLIDGSNVAHNSNGQGKSKAYVGNITRLTEELKRLGFHQITIIADASLKYRLEDKEQLSALQKEVTYIEAPAETSADVFMIEWVKKERCLLVSNDTFRDWKLKDVWVAKYIDFYRLSFIMKDKTVIIPHFEKAVGNG